MLIRNLREGAVFLHWGDPAFIAWAKTYAAKDSLLLFVQTALNIDTPRLGLNVLGTLTRRTRTQLLEALDSIKPSSKMLTSARAFAYLCLCITLLKMPSLRVTWRGSREISIDQADNWMSAVFDIEKSKAGDTEVTGYVLQEAAFFDFTLTSGAPPLWAERAALALSNVEYVVRRAMKDWHADIWDNLDAGGPVQFRTIMDQVLRVWDFLVNRLSSLGSATASPMLALRLGMMLKENKSTLAAMNLRDDLADALETDFMHDLGTGLHVNAPEPLSQLNNTLPSRAEQRSLALYLPLRSSFLDRLGYAKVSERDVIGLLDISVIDNGQGRKRGLVIRWKHSNTRAPQQTVFNIIPAGNAGEVRVQRLIDIPLSREYRQLAENLDIAHHSHALNVLRRSQHGSAPNYFIISDVPEPVLRLLATTVANYVYKEGLGYRYEVNPATVPNELRAQDEICRFFGISVDVEQALPFLCQDYATPLIAAMLTGRLREQRAPITTAPALVNATGEVIKPDPRRYWRIGRIVDVTILYPSVGRLQSRTTVRSIGVLDGMHDQIVPYADDAEYFCEANLEFHSQCHFSAWMHGQALRLASNSLGLIEESCNLLAPRLRRSATLGLQWQIWRTARTAQPYPLYWTDTDRVTSEYITAAQFGFYQLVCAGAQVASYYLMVGHISPISAFAVREVQRIIAATGLTGAGMMRETFDRALATGQAEAI